MPRSRNGGTILPPCVSSSGSQMPRIMSRLPPPSAPTMSYGGRTASSTRGGIMPCRGDRNPQPNFAPSSGSSSKMLIVRSNHSCGAACGAAGLGFAWVTVVLNCGMIFSWNSGKCRKGRWKGSARASMGQRWGGAGCSGSYVGTSLRLIGYGLIWTSGMSGWVLGRWRSSTLNPSKVRESFREPPMALSAIFSASRASAADSPFSCDRSTRGW
mmetsp:Transcript_36816/g.95008  ORF Transcript_36816/g.95008 Transcript_36816/m.95008 type:complete len:213 (+) Transcript_36816:1924-2562(+)